MSADPSAPLPLTLSLPSSIALVMGFVVMLLRDHRPWPSQGVWEGRGRPRTLSPPSCPRTLREAERRVLLRSICVFLGRDPPETPCLGRVRPTLGSLPVLQG